MSDSVPSVVPAAAAASVSAAPSEQPPLSKEEEKWREHLRSKREEERLRNYIRDKNRHKQEAAAGAATPKNGSSAATTAASTNKNAEHSSHGSSEVAKRENGKEESKGRKNHRRDKRDRGNSRKRSRSPPRRSASPSGRNHRHHHRHQNGDRGGDSRHNHRQNYHGNPRHGPPPNGGSGGGGPPPRHHYHAQQHPDSFYSGDYDDSIDPYGRQRRPVVERRPSQPHHANSGPIARGSRSRSRSPDNQHHRKGARGTATGTHRDRGGRRSRSRSRSVSSYSSRDSSRSSSSAGSRRSASSRSSSANSSRSANSVHSIDAVPEDEHYSKDQRTIFITQLVMRATERDIVRFFRAQKLPTNEVILLRDKRTGKHKGSAYVEMRRMADVITAVNLSGQAPDFQRFPILIKASEAERNYVPSGTSTLSIPPAIAAAATVPVNGVVPAVATTAVPAAVHQSIKLPQLTDENGKPIQAQKVYVGNLEANLVTSQHLHALFAPFGTLTEIQLQVGKGFAFLQFHDPKEAALAIQTMTGQLLAGRPMKTGWATNQGSINGMALVTSQEFPPDAATRAQNAYHVLAQLTTGSQMVTAAGVTVAQPTAAAPMFHSTTAAAPSVASGGASRVATVAEARASLAAAASGGMGATTTGPMGGAAVGAAAAAYHHPPAMAMSYATAVAEPALDPTKIGNAEHPTQHVLVHNMFDKDQETEVGWEKDIRDEFEEECSKYGRIASVTVMHKEAGGKIYVSFDSLDGAKTCAVSLAGRWFDKRQLRVEYVSGDVIRQVTTQIEMQGVDGK